MYLETVNEIDFNSGLKGTKNGKIRAYIESFSWMQDFTVIGVNYRYEELDGTIIKRDGKTIDLAKIEMLNTAVEPLLEETDYRLKEMERVYLGFMFEMAATFQIQTSNINLIKP